MVHCLSTFGQNIPIASKPNFFDPNQMSVRHVIFPIYSKVSRFFLFLNLITNHAARSTKNPMKRERYYGKVICTLAQILNKIPSHLIKLDIFYFNKILMYLSFQKYWHVTCKCLPPKSQIWIKYFSEFFHAPQNIDIFQIHGSQSKIKQCLLCVLTRFVTYSANKKQFHEFEL